MTHIHDWASPSPLWGSNSFRQVEFFRPALFEYRSDDFMDIFLAAAGDRNPASLQAARLQPPPSTNGSQQPVRLFQPAHGCFYLAAASLCCRQPSFPSRTVRKLEGENAFFVVRKLLGGQEYAWVVTDKSKTWQPVGGSGRTLVEGEERRPVFPVTTAVGRTLHAGYIPVSSSETYNVPAGQLVVDGEPLDLPIRELESRFTGQLADLENLPVTPTNIAFTTSVYLLLDLWEYFDTYLPDVAAALRDDLNATFSGPKAAAKTDLMSTLKSLVVSGSLSLAAALQKAAQNQDNLNAPGGGDLSSLGFTNACNLANSSAVQSATQTLIDKVKAALADQKPGLALPRLDPSVSVRYVIRFVYERPQCDPPQVEVGQPSQPFVFAPFFDPDAPARPIRITLPTDVSIAGLRKFKKGVTFIMSDAMRKKMKSLMGKEDTFLDDHQLNPEDGGAFAFVCSFSIQIIFIVAFMLLLMFVVIFNLIFWWLPFFRICLPVPKSLFPE
jgi:hypothetical protein